MQQHGRGVPHHDSDDKHRVPHAAQSWQEWLVTADSVEDVATEMSAAVREYAEPYVRRLANDSTAALAAVKAAPPPSRCGGYPTVATVPRFSERRRIPRGWALKTMRSFTARAA